MTNEHQRPALAEFSSGLFAGIGIILVTWLLAIVTVLMFAKFTRLPGYGPRPMAVLWAVLALGMGFLIFRYGVRQKRPSSFNAGLVTAAALFLLLDAACWSF